MTWLREHSGELGFAVLLGTLVLVAVREIRWQIRENRLRNTASRVYQRLAKREVQR